jgi:seryl-tRNA synthetase
VTKEIDLSRYSKETLIAYIKHHFLYGQDTDTLDAIEYDIQSRKYLDELERLNATANALMCKINENNKKIEAQTSKKAVDISITNLDLLKQLKDIWAKNAKLNKKLDALNNQ